MRIATYTRISTDEVNQPYSLGAQAERLGAYIASQEDWELVTTFTDQISGRSSNARDWMGRSGPPRPDGSTSSPSARD